MFVTLGTFYKNQFYSSINSQAVNFTNKITQSDAFLDFSTII